MSEPTLLRKAIESPTISEGRVPPQAVDIECQVLGAMMLESDCIPKVIETIDEDAFHADYHKKIFQAIASLFQKNQPADTITLAEELRRRGHLELIGGEPYLAELSMNVTSGANVEYHARIVLEKSLMRALITGCSNITNRAFSSQEDAFELLDEAQQAIYTIAEKKIVGRGSVSARDAVHQTLEHFEKINGQSSVVSGVPTGFRELDELTTGWQPGDLTIIAGRPSSGKTAFALALAKNAALHKEKKSKVDFHSLEMSTVQLTSRLLCTVARVDHHAWRRGRLPQEDWKTVSLAAAQISEASLWIDDTSSLDILGLRAKARRAVVEKNANLIIVDYLQLMAGSGKGKNETREREIGIISRGLKTLAKDLHVPIIALSQLSRGVETRSDHRPMLADLRESGSIEQDADNVIFVHRPEMYEKPGSDEFEKIRGIAEIIIGKQRNGPIDDIKLTFVHKYASFEESAKQSLLQSLQQKDEQAF